ncbi:hypothetical protein [Tenacibaculum aestuarii]|uniref:hypothetical protein n=1 Tax=Tenacibaculum aestuarii TaxID=362781 RepID=UPI0038943F76
MKNTVVFLLFSFLSLSFFSCSDSETIEVISEGYIEAKVEGSFFRKDFKFINSKEFSLAGIDYNQYFDVNINLKVNDLNDKIVITIENVTDVGVFEINGLTSTYISFYDGSNKKNYHTNYNFGTGISVGKITVTKLDKKNKIIEGTFEGRLLEGQELIEEKIISEGKFSGTYFNLEI